MRTPSVICVGSVLFLSLSAVIGDNDGRIARARGVSEVFDFSRDQSTVKSSSSKNDVDFLPIITGVRIKREIGTNCSGDQAARKEREGKRKKQKRERDQRRGREREREANTERYRARKRGGKSEPLTRHARRPQRRRCRGPDKEAGANRSCSRHRSHERRNLEKQYLVRNRTLELLDRPTSEANSSAFVHPVNNVRDVLFGRRITPGKIGQLLGDGRSPPSLRITDLLIPKTFLNPGTKKEGDTESRSNQTAEIISKKLKTIALNVSRMNKAAQKMKERNSSVEDETSYRLVDYENVFEDPSVSPWVNPPKSKEAPAAVPRRSNEEYFLDTALLSSVYMPIDEQITLHRGLATLLSRLFQSLTNNTEDDNQELLQELDFDNSVQGDLCQKWLDCKEKLEEAFLGPLVLPACPCHYPSSIFYDDKIWDEGQQKHFRWRDVSGEGERLDVYKSGATYCIRSLLTQGGGSAAAQHCCYDGRRRLLTRGSGAGTPNLVSPEVSAVLHERIDILPWRLCKGDFSRFNKVRPPNNGNGCTGNPDDEEYQRQIDTTKHY